MASRGLPSTWPVSGPDDSPAEHLYSQDQPTAYERMTERMASQTLAGENKSPSPEQVDSPDPAIWKPLVENHDTKTGQWVSQQRAQETSSGGDPRAGPHESQSTERTVTDHLVSGRKDRDELPQANDEKEVDAARERKRKEDEAGANDFLGRHVPENLWPPPYGDSKHFEYPDQVKKNLMDQQTGSGDSRLKTVERNDDGPTKKEGKGTVQPSPKRPRRNDDPEGKENMGSEEPNPRKKKRSGKGALAQDQDQDQDTDMADVPKPEAKAKSS